MKKLISPDKKTIQKRRIMTYFIEAATQIIDEEGIEGITTRKVADIAGYNSSTMYNYFENLDHLIFFALLNHLKIYLVHLGDYIKDAKDALDKYFLIWEVFCYHSFQNPRVYNTLFFKQFNQPLQNMMQEYYDIFPEEMKELGEELNPMLLNQNLDQRNLALLKNCVNEGFLQEEVLEELNEMTLLIYQSMLQRVLTKQVEYTPKEATRRTLKYIKKCIKVYNNCVETTT
ncbi:MAG: TetR/AcrR family transcriptional regulator [Bacillota bacterium]